MESKKVKKYNYKKIAKVHKIFSSATRLEIMFILSEGDEDFSSLLKMLKISKSSLSQHINILSYVNFLSVEKKGRNVTCKIANRNALERIQILRGLVNKDEIDIVVR